jgi:hypothetical protein
MAFMPSYMKFSRMIQKEQWGGEEKRFPKYGSVRCKVGRGDNNLDMTIRRT